MMNRKLVLTAAAAAVFSALAAAAASAADIKLYGIIEDGILVQKQKGQNATVELKSAMDLGSRVGLKGSEDLGNGWRAGFVLESGFNPDDGTFASGTNGFTRESTLYVENDGFGRLAFGRLAKFSSGLGTFDMLTGYAFMGGYGLAGWDQNCNNDFLRLNNVIAWKSAKTAGLQVGLMYSNGVVSEGTGWSDNRHFYGGAVRYDNGPLTSSLIVEATDSTPSDKSTLVVNWGVEYKLEGWTPMFAYRYYEEDDGLEIHKVGLSAKVPCGPGRFKVAATYLWGNDRSSNVGTDKVDRVGLAAAYEWSLSKRTVVKPFIGWADSGDAWENKTTGPGKTWNVWQAYIGLHHFF